MLMTPWVRVIRAFACAIAIAPAQSSFGALLINYQFEEVVGSPPTGQTTPDFTGNFVSNAANTNRVLGHNTNTPGTDFPILAAGPVQNTAAGLRSRNKDWFMNFPGNPATGNIAANAERVEIADGSTGALKADFGNFSVALWLNPSSTDRDRYAVGKMGGSGQRGWSIASQVNSTNLMIDYFSTGTTGDRTLIVPNALPLNTWTHVIFTFDGANQTEAIYINNRPQSFTASGSLTSVPSIINADNTQSFKVGHRGATGNTVGSWAGGIDDVMIFDHTLAHTRAGSSSGTGMTLVPEPSPYLLMTLGSIGLAMLRRRTKI
jgi:hypothetical protein